MSRRAALRRSGAGTLGRLLEGGLNVLELDRIGKVYKVGTFGGTSLTAVRDVTFDVRPGEVVSLIGESGSGKSTIGKLILRLISLTSGSISMDGMDIATLRGEALRGYYRSVQGVFQDPFSSYNPIFKVDHVFDLIRSVYLADLGGEAWRSRLDASLEAVSLDPAQILHKYPHQLSGGQLQRLLIARALTLDTKLLVADEIISMLDASTRIDVLNLLGDLKARGLGILFITHDLSLANYISERAIILRRGRVVESGPTAAVFGNPLHPYTQQLLGAVPRLHEKWGTVSRSGRADACCYHDTVTASPAAGQPAMVEAEPGHLVGCANLYGVCPGDTDAEVRATA
jgi:peptide/nickel transport system ATP-binding protein